MALIKLRHCKPGTYDACEIAGDREGGVMEFWSQSCCGSVCSELVMVVSTDLDRISSSS